MAAVTIYSDFGAQKNKVSHSFHCFPIYFPWSDGTGMPWSSFSECWGLSQLFHSPLSLSSRGFLVPLHFLPSIFPSRVFSNQSALHIRWRNYWRFIFTKSPSSEYSELISFRVDPFDLLAVQGTFKSLLQHQNLKASILGAQPSLWSNFHIHTYIWTFVRKVMSLLFNTLSRFVIAFLPRSKHLLILWLHSPSTAILSLRK